MAPASNPRSVYPHDIDAEFAIRAATAMAADMHDSVIADAQGQQVAHIVTAQASVVSAWATLAIALQGSDRADAVAHLAGHKYRLVECPGGGWRDDQPGSTGLRLSHDESIPPRSRPVYRLEPLEET